MIHLQCPQCHAKFDLDAAFAAGVCRCPSCAQMMKVPATPPRLAPARPTSPGASSGRESPSPPPDEIIDLIAAEPRRVPRGLVIVSVVLGALVFGGLSVFVLVQLTDSNSTPQPQVSVEQVMGGYDPAINPFLLEAPNLLGVPLQGRSAALVDASGTSRRWFGLIKDVIAASFLRLPAANKLQLVFWSETGPVVFPADGPSGSPTDTMQAELESLLAELSASGQADPAPALKAALAAAPGQLVIVTSQPMERGQIQAVAQLLEPHPNVRLDVVAIDLDLPELAELAHAHRGIYVSLPQQRLETWFREARSSGR